MKYVVKKSKEFFKPTFVKIILTLIFFIPILLLIFFIFKAPFLEPLFLLKFFILRKVFDFFVTIFGILAMIFMAVQGCYGDVGDINSCANVVNQTISFILALIAFIAFTYFVSCCIIAIWNKIFLKKSKSIQKIILIIFLSLFLIFAILLPAIGKITLEKSPLPTELNRVNAFSKDFRFRELTIKNNLLLPVKYRLPNDITICVYDSKKELKPTIYSIAYKDDDKFIPLSYMDKQNIFYIISLRMREEKKVYISEFAGGLTDIDLDNYLETMAMLNIYKTKADELLFFENVGFNNVTYCERLTDKDIINAKRIKLVND